MSVEGETCPIMYVHIQTQKKSLIFPFLNENFYTLGMLQHKFSWSASMKKGWGENNFELVSLFWLVKVEVTWKIELEVRKLGIKAHMVEYMGINGGEGGWKINLHGFMNWKNISQLHKILATPLMGIDN